MRAAAVAVALLAACVHHDITVEPTPFVDHAGELAAGQAVTVTDSDGSAHEMQPDDSLDLVDTRGVHHKITAVQLAQPRADISRVVIAHELWLSAGAQTALALGLVLAGAAGAVYCGFDCSSPTNEIVGIGAGVLAAGAVLYELAYASATSSVAKLQ